MALGLQLPRQMRFIARLSLFAGMLCRVHADSPATAEFPFDFSEGLIWVRVDVSGSREPLDFLLDSGANVSVINLRTAKHLGLKLGPQVSVRGVQKTAKGYWPQNLAAKICGVPLPRDYLVLDLQGLARACHRSLDGLLGADFFREYVVQIDFKSQRIRLLTSVEPPQGADVVPLEVRACGLRVPLRVNAGEAQWVRLDTGCATPLQWVTTSVDVKKCMRQMAVALTKFSVPTTQVDVQIGTSFFESVPTGLHKKEIFAGESGLLGNGLLSRFAIATIDIKASRLVLEKQPAQGD
jgi:hypothetical protein